MFEVCACVIDYDGNWVKYLPLVEFVYNNSYDSSIGMTPSEALYGRSCRFPTRWFDPSKANLFDPNLVY